MNIARAVAACFILVLANGCRRPGASQPQNSTRDQQYEQKFFDKLVSALATNGQAGLFEYRGTCNAENSDVISMPDIRLENSADSATGLPKIQEMFRDDHNYTVKQQPSGSVYIRGADVRGEILQVPIAHITFNADEQYNPADAISALLHSKEVTSAMRRFNTRRAMTLGGLRVIPSNSVRHLNESMDNVTVNQAVDEVLQKFGGLIVYKECTRPDGLSLFNVIYHAE